MSVTNVAQFPILLPIPFRRGTLMLMDDSYRTNSEPSLSPDRYSTMLTVSIEHLRWQWDNMPDADRRRIFSTVVARDGFLNELHQRKPYSALVMAACLEELARHARPLPPA